MVKLMKEHPKEMQEDMGVDEEGKLTVPLCQKVPSSGDHYICPIRQDGETSLEGYGADSPSAWVKLRSWDFCVPPLEKTTEDIDDEATVGDIQAQVDEAEQRNPGSTAQLENSLDEEGNKAEQGQVDPNAQL